MTPGWLFRAGIASCATASIAMHAAAEGVVLTELEARADSRTDSRASFGLPGDDGAPAEAAPYDLRLAVRVRAQDVPVARLRAVVEEGLGRSPIPAAVRRGSPLHVEIDAASEVTTSAGQRHRSNS